MQRYREGGQIREWMWVGSAEFASDKALLKRCGITHILNVADNVPNYFQGFEDFEYLNLGVADFGKDKGISRVFQDAVRFSRLVASGFLAQQGDENKKPPVLLIHCHAGINRSVTIAIAILMEMELMSLRQAFDQVRSTRSDACPFLDNILELYRYEQEMFGTTSFTSADDFRQYILDVQ